MKGQLCKWQLRVCETTRKEAIKWHWNFIACLPDVLVKAMKINDCTLYYQAMQNWVHIINGIIWLSHESYIIPLQAQGREHSTHPSTPSGRQAELTFELPWILRTMWGILATRRGAMLYEGTIPEMATISVKNNMRDKAKLWASVSGCKGKVPFSDTFDSSGFVDIWYNRLKSRTYLNQGEMPLASLLTLENDIYILRMIFLAMIISLILEQENQERSNHLPLPIKYWVVWEFCTPRPQTRSHKISIN